MKFIEFSENDRIQFLKDEFIRSIEECMVDPAEIAKIIPDKDMNKVIEFLPAFQEKLGFTCNCKTCLDMRVIAGKIPDPLHPLIKIAKERCLNRTY